MRVRPSGSCAEPALRLSPTRPCPSSPLEPEGTPTAVHPVFTSGKAGSRLHRRNAQGVYLEVKQSFPKLHPFFNVRNGAVKAALGQPQHLREGDQNFHC